MLDHDHRKIIIPFCAQESHIFGSKVCKGNLPRYISQALVARAMTREAAMADNAPIMPIMQSWMPSLKLRTGNIKAVPTVAITEVMPVKTEYSCSVQSNFSLVYK